MPGSRPRFSVASRSGGAKACARAAYRSGERIEDRTYGGTHYYSRQKSGVLHSEINAPDHAPEWVQDRGELWNRVEESELKKDGTIKVRAQLARDVVVPLPHELSLQENAALMREWVGREFVAKGMIADWSIHEADKFGDQRNIHAHLMLTMRAITEDGFSADKMAVRSWNDKELVIGSIDRFEKMQNRELERRGVTERADFSSFETRGIDREAQQHEGPAVTNMRRKDKDSRIARDNDQREARNDARTTKHVEYLKELARIAAERSKFEDWAAEKRGKLESGQNLSKLDFQREQERRFQVFDEDLKQTYAPSLNTMQYEADRLQTRLTDPGMKARLVRLWSGRGDREKFDKLQSSIEDAHSRMQEQRDKRQSQDRVAMAQFVQRQEQAKQAQHEGIERACDRKENSLAERLAKATVWDQPRPEDSQRKVEALKSGLEERLRRADANQTEQVRQETHKTRDNDREM